MRLLTSSIVSSVVVVSWALAAPPATIGTNEQAWAKALASVGLRPEQADLLIGDSPAARAIGITATAERVVVRRIVDDRRPQLEIYWNPPAEIPRFTGTAGLRVFARERWTGTPVMAGAIREGRPVLWLATDLGVEGYERYPYLLQALADLGLRPPAQGRHLWAFFDSSYRLRADMDLMAKRWRESGIAAIHVAAWHYWEPDAQRDAWLAKLIETCHRNAVQVYAWVELPHVSEKFWNDHPEWREKTATLGDAHLDWRKLMNLQNADCVREVETGLRKLTARFDWDGVNLGELYFESLEGAGNPARFTPMNDDVRREFRAEAGVDPLDLFMPRAEQEGPPVKKAAKPGEKAKAGAKAKDSLARFLDYRAKLARKMQTDWLAIADSLRQSKPHLDLVLTHVDDRFDTDMRSLLGADAAAVLPLLAKHDFTFLIEDPATVWHLGPKRYPEIAKRYAPLTNQAERLAIDINIVERYQDVYPTKQQTGVELFQLVGLASSAFSRVALYFENSILAPDVPLLAAAAAGGARVTASSPNETNGALIVEAERDVRVRFTGPVLVDGRLWPVYDDEWVHIPAGRHRIERASMAPAIRVTDLNGKLLSAEVSATGIAIEYESSSRAFAVVDGRAERLPRGRHRLSWTAKAPFTQTSSR